MRLILAFALAFQLSTPLQAAACDTEATERPDSECVTTQRGARRGVWFQLSLADTLRQEHIEIGELRLQIEHFEALRNIQTERIRLYDEALTMERRASEALSGLLNASHAREAEASGRENAWHRSPTLWFAVGVLVSTGIVVAATR